MSPFILNLNFLFKKY